MTPLEASKPENKDEVKLRLELQRRNDNPQPKLKVGDEVRVLRKKKTSRKATLPITAKRPIKLWMLFKRRSTGKLNMFST